MTTLIHLYPASLPFSIDACQLHHWLDSILAGHNCQQLPSPAAAPLPAPVCGISSTSPPWRRLSSSPNIAPFHHRRLTPPPLAGRHPSWPPLSTITVSSCGPLLQDPSAHPRTSALALSFNSALATSYLDFNQPLSHLYPPTSVQHTLASACLHQPSLTKASPGALGTPVGPGPPAQVPASSIPASSIHATVLAASFPQVTAGHYIRRR